MKPTALALSVLALSAVAAAPAAGATTVTGWFEGTIVDAEATYPVPPRPVEDYLGATARGSFRLDIDDAAASQMPFDETVPLPGPMRLSVTVLGSTFSYALAGGSFEAGLWEVASSGGQVELRSDFRPRFDGFIFDLQSADDALRTGATPADLRIDETTVSGMALYFASAQAHASFDVGITSFGFGGIAAPVPEPAAPLLMAAGVAAVLARRRRPWAPVDPSDSGGGFASAATSVHGVAP